MDPMGIGPLQEAPICSESNVKPDLRDCAIIFSNKKKSRNPTDVSTFKGAPKLPIFWQILTTTRNFGPKPKTTKP